MNSAAFHRCKNVRLDSTFRENSNSVTLEVMTDRGRCELTFYDLPPSITEKFEVFRDEYTHDYKVEEEDDSDRYEYETQQKE